MNKFIFSFVIFVSFAGNVFAGLDEIDCSMGVDKIQKSFPGGYLGSESYAVVNKIMNYNNTIMIFYFNEQREIRDISFIFPKRNTWPIVQTLKYSYMNKHECRKMIKDLSRKLTKSYGEKNLNSSTLSSFSVWFTKDKNLILLGMTSGGKNKCTPTINFLNNRKK